MAKPVILKIRRGWALAILAELESSLDNGLETYGLIRRYKAIIKALYVALQKQSGGVNDE